MTRPAAPDTLEVVCVNVDVEISFDRENQRLYVRPASPAAPQTSPHRLHHTNNNNNSNNSSSQSHYVPNTHASSSAVPADTSPRNGNHLSLVSPLSPMGPSHPTWETSVSPFLSVARRENDGSFSGVPPSASVDTLGPCRLESSHSASGSAFFAMHANKHA